MDAKRHQQARGHRQQVARLDTVCAGLNHLQRELTLHAKAGSNVKVAVEYDMQDGFVDIMRITRETRIIKIPRQAAA